MITPYSKKQLRGPTSISTGGLHSRLTYEKFWKILFWDSLQKHDIIEEATVDWYNNNIQ